MASGMKYPPRGMPIRGEGQIPQPDNLGHDAFGHENPNRNPQQQQTRVGMSMNEPMMKRAKPGQQPNGDVRVEGAIARGVIAHARRHHQLEGEPLESRDRHELETTHHLPGTGMGVWWCLAC